MESQLCRIIEGWLYSKLLYEFERKKVVGYPMAHTNFRQKSKYSTQKLANFSNYYVIRAIKKAKEHTRSEQIFFTNFDCGVFYNAFIQFNSQYMMLYADSNQLLIKCLLSVAIVSRKTSSQWWLASQIGHKEAIANDYATSFIICFETAFFYPLFLSMLNFSVIVARHFLMA